MTHRCGFKAYLMIIPKYAVGLGGRGVSAAQDGEITSGIEVGGRASSCKTLNGGKEWPVVRREPK